MAQNIGEILIATPDIPTSSGHNRLGYLLMSMASAIVDSDHVKSRSFPNDRDPLTSRFLWHEINRGKNASEGNGPVADIFKNFSTWIREQEVITRILMAGMLKEYIENNAKPVVFTSHYMVAQALNSKFAPPPKILLLTPDLNLHNPFIKAAKAGNVRVISTSPSATSQLVEAEVDESKITHGMIYPTELLDVRAERIGYREKFANASDSHTTTILITLGAGNIYVQEVVDFLTNFETNPQIKFKVIVNPKNIAGQELERSVRFANDIRNLAEEREDIEVVGDPNMDRDELIKLFYKELEDPEVLFILTRPNEIPGIVIPLGIMPILLPPFQIHEENARELMLKRQATIDYLKAQSADNLRINLVRSLEMAGKPGHEPVFYQPTLPIEDM